MLQKAKDKIPQENAERAEIYYGAGNRVQNVVLLLLLAERISVSPKRTRFTLAAHTRHHVINSIC